MARYACAHLPSSVRFNCTPPTSVLCVTISECTFSTTGKPSFCALDYGLFFVLREPGRNGGDSVEFQDLLRLDFCQKRSARGCHALDELPGLLPPRVRTGRVVVPREGVSYRPRRRLGIAPHRCRRRARQHQDRKTSESRKRSESRCPPRHFVRPSNSPATVFRVSFAWAFTRSATCAGFVIPCGARITSSPSLLGSCKRDIQSARVTLRVGIAQNVDGICVAPVCGKKRAERLLESSENAASSPPPAINASVARTPARRRWSESSAVVRAAAAVCRELRPYGRAPRYSEPGARRSAETPRHRLRRFPSWRPCAKPPRAKPLPSVQP